MSERSEALEELEAAMDALAALGIETIVQYPIIFENEEVGQAHMRREAQND